MERLAGIRVRAQRSELPNISNGSAGFWSMISGENSPMSRCSISRRKKQAHPQPCTMFQRGTRRFKAMSQGLCGGHLCGETSTQLPLGDNHIHGGRLVAYVWTRGTRAYMVLWGPRACAGLCERKKTLKRLKRPAGKGALFSGGIFHFFRYSQGP